MHNKCFLDAVAYRLETESCVVESRNGLHDIWLLDAKTALPFHSATFVCAPIVFMCYVLIVTSCWLRRLAAHVQSCLAKSLINPFACKFKGGRGQGDINGVQIVRFGIAVAAVMYWHHICDVDTAGFPAMLPVPVGLRYLNHHRHFHVCTLTHHHCIAHRSHARGVCKCA